jgi:hypothetical protein
VVVYGYRERLLGLILTDDIAVEEVIDLARLRQLVEAELTGLGELLLDDFVTQVDALVADIDARACDELFDLLLALPAEGALEQVTGLTDSCHERFVPLCLPRSNGTWLGRTPRSRTVPGIVREVLCNRRVRRGDEPAPALRGSMP